MSPPPRAGSRAAPAGAPLVLSGSIGQGHDSVATACAAALACAGEPAPILDCMALLGSSGQRAGTALFRRALGVRPLYDAFHFSALREGAPLARRIGELSTARILDRLRNEVDARRPPLVLAVFATGAGALGRLRAERTEPRAVVLCTDATAHRLWVAEGIDRFLVCSEMAAGTVRQYLPRAEVVVIPPPVRAEFFAAPAKEEARRRLGLAPAAPTVLVVAGAWGTGPLEEVASGLLAAGLQVVVLAGGDRRRRRIEELARRELAPRRERLLVLGYSDEMPALIAASDVVVTSPGQVCNEARAVGRPLVVLDSVPGHGRENLLLELTRPGALAAPPRRKEVVAATAAVLDGVAGSPGPWPVAAAAEWSACLREAVGV